MDYLDPKKIKMHRLRLWVGYALVSIGIAMASIILLWQAYGYGVKNGQVIQDGMVFVSSQPNAASIYVNGVLNAATTNTRLNLPSGVYKFKLTSPGYLPWTHTIPVFGGQVVHYDYPLLFPAKLSRSVIAKYTSVPEVASQSPSQQYLVVSSPDNFNNFLLYDLTNPTAPAVTLSLPANLLTPTTTTQSWQVVGWADDNQHLLLEHVYSGGQEFIELDTQNPSQSININRQFNANPSTVSFNNLKYNQFYFYDASSQTLSTADLSNTTPVQVETGVLAYKSYGSHEFLYVTASGAPTGQVAVYLNNSGKTYLVRYLPSSPTYLLNQASYNGNNYALIGASSDSFVYLYENPLGQATSGSSAKIVPFLAMKITAPNYDSFAPTAQFVMVENGTNFVIYDIYNNLIYHYSVTAPLDAPQTHVNWMDGNRLVFVSGGNINEADYDNTNRHTLTPALPQFNQFFAPDYHSYFAISQNKTGGAELYQTSLLAS